tara:strand:+ start:1108 stop:1485 length:378 start_codon:yes stop_codon:yes gene_type:complete
LDFRLYEKIIKEGEKIDWYGTEVPKDLINKKVIFISENLHKEIDDLKSKLLNTRGSGFDKMEHYIKALENNLKNLPYSLNGDCYLKKKKIIEQSIQEKQPKQTKTSKKKVKKTKNSNIIFGNKTK